MSELGSAVMRGARMDARDHRPRGNQSADGRSSRRAVQGGRAQRALGVLRHMETKLGRGKRSEPAHGVLSGQFDFLQRWERGKGRFGRRRGNGANVSQQRVRFFADEQMGDRLGESLLVGERACLAEPDDSRADQRLRAVRAKPRGSQQPNGPRA